MFRKKVLFILFAALALYSCSDNNSSVSETKKPEESKPAPDESFQESFLIGSQKTDSGHFLTIKKEGLGQEFLMQSTWVPQKNYGDIVYNPTAESRRSRIVKFEDHGADLIMVDSTGKTKPGNELPSNILVTSFPIVEHTEKGIVFDFNKGMNQAILTAEWYASDDYGEIVTPDMSIYIEDSYLRQIKGYPSAISVVHNVTINDGNYKIPIELTYYFTLYAANPNFKPVESPGFKYLGYFETNPLVHEKYGNVFSYTTRFDISKPVTFYISSSFPKEYQQTAIEGVLYWNKVFGKEVVKAEYAPEGLTAPDFEHNIIQWHTHDNSNAYADAQVDPRTGEILHAQVFIASSFVNVPKDYRIPVLERELEDKESGNGQPATAKTSGPKILDMMQKTELCRLNASDIANDLANFRAETAELSPERIDALAQDYMRWTVAHEVGHTLGLRHNFAASTVNELSFDEVMTTFRNYMKSGTLPSNFPLLVNSTMDYSTLFERILSGASIKRADSKGLPYDVYAIKWGYFDWTNKPKYEEHPFCTDSQLFYYADCQQGDSGKHLVEQLSSRAVYNLSNLPRLLSEIYLSAKLYPNKNERGDLKTPSSRTITSSVLLPFLQMTSLFTNRLNLLSIMLTQPDYTNFDEPEIVDLHLDWLNKEIENTGGIKKVLGLIDPNTYRSEFSNFQSEFEKITSSSAFRNAALPEGGTVSFTKDELKYINSHAQEVFAAVKNDLAAGITSSLINLSGNIPLIEQIETYESVLPAWTGYLITAGTKLDFDFSISTRRQAVGLLLGNGPLPDWMGQYVSPVAETLKAKLEDAFGMPIDQVDIKGFPREEQGHIAQEIALYLMLQPRMCAATANGGKTGLCGK